MSARCEQREATQPITDAQRFQPTELVVWERPGRPPVRGIVLRDQGRVAVKVRIGDKIYHPLRRHVRAA